MDLGDHSNGELAVFGGAALAVVGAFLPWITLGPFSKTGIDGDGSITLVLGVVAAGVVLWRGFDRVGRGVAVVCGLVVGGIGAMYVADPALGIDQRNVFTAALQPASGVYVTAVAGALILGGGVAGGDESEQGEYARERPPGEPRRESRGEPRREPRGDPDWRGDEPPRRDPPAESPGEQADERGQPRYRREKSSAERSDGRSDRNGDDDPRP